LNGSFSANSNNAFTGTRSRRAICSMVSNDGALMPRSDQARRIDSFKKDA
jgi:hypothetical protein